jgi:hypothetical protein
MMTTTMMMMMTMMDCRRNVPTLSLGHAIAQAVSLRPFVTETWAQSQVSPCGICDGKSGHGTGLFQNNFTGTLSSHMHLLPTSYNLCNLTASLMEPLLSKTRSLTGTPNQVWLLYSFS